MAEAVTGSGAVATTLGVAGAALGINYHYFDEFLVPKSPHKEASLFHLVRILE